MKSSGNIYAMKVMRKEKILEKDHGEYIKSERDVLTAVFHPYIVTLRYSFQVAPSSKHCYLMQEELGVILIANDVVPHRASNAAINRTLNALGLTYVAG